MLHWLLRTDPTAFRTGWFLESVISATLIVLVVRTRGRVTTSLPSAALLTATAAIIGAAVTLPFTRWAALFDFAAVPASLVAWVVAIVIAYVVSAEFAKRWLFQKLGF